MSFRILPLSDIRVFVDAFPDTVALLEPLIPLTIVDLTIFPGVDAFTVGSSVLELAVVSVAIGVSLETFAVSQVMIPETFILATVRIFHDAFTVPLA